MPQKSRHAVVHALEEQGFAFEPQSNGHGYNMTNMSSPLTHRRNTSSSSGFDLSPQQPSTPPPTSIAEWQIRTFATLCKHNIAPTVDRSISLATCAGHRADKDTTDRLLYGLHRCLIAGPRFISITMTEADSVSLTLERQSLQQFPQEGKDILLMSEDTVVPIMFDLRGLPDESAGIICGVAGRLIDRMHGQLGTKGGTGSGAGGFNMSYLSTAKAGNVIVLEDEAENALEALEEIEKAVEFEQIAEEEKKPNGRWTF